MRTIEASPLEHMLLGLLGQGPRSAYDLRKLFVATPLRHFSDSPGAIYPAVRRLLARRWIEAGAPKGARRRQELELTARGRAAFLAWLGLPVTRKDVILHGEQLLLRFALMGGNLPASSVVRFLRAYRAEMIEYLGVLRLYHSQNAEYMPLTGRLAFEHGIAQYDGCVRWAAKALETVQAGGGGSRGRGAQGTREA